MWESDLHTSISSPPKQVSKASGKLEGIELALKVSNIRCCLFACISFWESFCQAVQCRVEETSLCFLPVCFLFVFSVCVFSLCVFSLCVVSVCSLCVFSLCFLFVFLIRLCLLPHCQKGYMSKYKHWNHFAVVRACWWAINWRYKCYQKLVVSYFAVNLIAV